MTDIELKELKDSLWHAADVLFKQNKEAIMSEYEKIRVDVFRRQLRKSLSKSVVSTYLNVRIMIL